MNATISTFIITLITSAPASDSPRVDREEASDHAPGHSPRSAGGGTPTSRPARGAPHDATQEHRPRRRALEDGSRTRRSVRRASASVAAGSGSKPPRPAVDLASLARKALAAHPSVKQIEARIRVARAKVDQASAYPDPKVTVGLVNMPFWPARFDETPMTGLQVTLTQVIPWPTKRSLAGEVASRRADVAAAALREARLRLGAAIRIGWLELALRDAERRIEKEREVLLGRLLKLVQVRYRVHKAQLQDLLKARLRRSRVADRQLRIARARDAAEARLNALLGRPAAASLPAAVPVPRAPTLQRTLPQLLATARRKRPALTRWKRRMAVQSLRRKQARTGFYPDLGVSLGYRYRQDSGMDPVDGMDFWSVGVSVRIPLWSIGKTRAAVKEADAALTRDRSGYENERLEVARQVRTARDAVKRLQSRLRLYQRRILPEARQTLEAAIASYTTGKLDFLSVLDHEEALYSQRLAALQIRVRLAQQWAALRAAVGELPTRLQGEQP